MAKNFNQTNLTADKRKESEVKLEEQSKRIAQEEEGFQWKSKHNMHYVPSVFCPREVQNFLQKKNKTNISRHLQNIKPINKSKVSRAQVCRVSLKSVCRRAAIEWKYIHIFFKLSLSKRSITGQIALPHFFMRIIYPLLFNCRSTALSGAAQEVLMNANCNPFHTCAYYFCTRPIVDYENEGAAIYIIDI